MKRCLSVLLAVAMVFVLLPAMAFADAKPAQAWSGDGTAEDLGGGWYLLKGDPSVPNMMYGPFASFSYLSETEDFHIGAGFVMSVKLDTTTVAAGEDFAWSFGLSENLADPDAYNYLNEIAFHFRGIDGGKAQLVNLQTNIDPGEGHDTADGIQSQQTFSPITSSDGIYELKAQFTPGENDALLLTVFVNGTEVATDFRMPDTYSQLKGPRYGWMFQCIPANGVKVTLPTVETLAVAEAGGVYYGTLEDAMAQAAAGTTEEDRTVTLVSDVSLAETLEVNTPNLVIDLNGYEISAAPSFNDAEHEQRLVDVLADGVTLKNGTLTTSSMNKHTLNVWGAEDVVLSDLVLDNTLTGTGGGAALIVGASDVTVNGTLKTITGANSWYAINVDSRNVSGTPTSASLTVENAEMTFEGAKPTGIFIENSVQQDAVVIFGENVAVNSEIESFVVVDIAENSGGTVSNPENADLVEDENGNLVVCEHTAVIVNAKEATCKEEGYTGDKVCSKCGKLLESGAAIAKVPHNFVNGSCTVCGEKDPNYVAPAPQIIAGANGSWKAGSADGLSFTSDAQFADFLKVTVDGAEIAPANYTKAEGSTIVTLTKDYLGTLKAGEHTLGIVSVNGTAETKFTIVAAAVSEPAAPSAPASSETGTTVQVPQTGDESPIAVWMLLAAAACVGAAGVVVLHKRREN